MSKAEADRLETTEGRTAATTVKGDGWEGAGGAQERGWSSSSSRDLTLYLFGRTGREKEEWFRRILLASKLKMDLKKAASGAGSKNGEQMLDLASAALQISSLLIHHSRKKHLCIQLYF